jgi:hypothetical protein
MGKRPKTTRREQGDSWAGVRPERRIPELYNSGILIVAETQTRRCTTTVSETDHAQTNSESVTGNRRGGGSAWSEH